MATGFGSFQPILSATVQVHHKRSSFKSHVLRGATSGDLNFVSRNESFYHELRGTSKPRSVTPAILLSYTGHPSSYDEGPNNALFLMLESLFTWKGLLPLSV